MKDNIAIIGFMGSGKTTIGRLLAHRLGHVFIDLDRVMELSEGRTINEIFEQKGEGYFRDIESEIIRKIVKNKNCIFACGGGVVVKRENMINMARSCHVIYLRISPSEARDRLAGSKERPLLPEKKRQDAIERIFKKRSGLYCRYADITVDNEGIQPGETVEAIIRKMDL